MLLRYLGLLFDFIKVKTNIWVWACVIVGSEHLAKMLQCSRNSGPEPNHIFGLKGKVNIF